MVFDFFWESSMRMFCASVRSFLRVWTLSQRPIKNPALLTTKGCSVITRFLACFNAKSTILTYLLTYLLTYCMQQNSSWEALSACQEMPNILWKWTFITVFTSAQPLSLIWARSIVTSYLYLRNEYGPLSSKNVASHERFSFVENNKFGSVCGQLFVIDWLIDA